MYRIHVLSSKEADFHSTLGEYDLEVNSLKKSKKDKSWSDKEYNKELDKLSRRGQEINLFIRSIGEYSEDDAYYMIHDGVLTQIDELTYLGNTPTLDDELTLGTNQIGVNGIVKWTDSVGNQHPACGLLVQVVDVNQPSLALDIGYTNEKGEYSLTVVDDVYDVMQLKITVFAQGDSVKVVST